jgi:hypothetical protein
VATEAEDPRSTPFAPDPFELVAAAYGRGVEPERTIDDPASRNSSSRLDRIGDVA